MLEPFYYTATTINDSWFALLYNIFDPKYSRIYTIQRGSYKSDKRLEYFWAIVRIKRPWERPLAVQLPENMNLPKPVEEDFINNYFASYLMDDKLEKNEIYRYSSSIKPQLEEIISMLRDTPDTNQACMSIGSPDSVFLDDPECCRICDWRMIDNTLHLYIYFRSNDLWSGYPVNLPGFQLLKEYICSEIGCNDGEILYNCKGLHLYSFQYEIAELRTNRTLTQFQKGIK